MCELDFIILCFTQIYALSNSKTWCKNMYLRLGNSTIQRHVPDRVRGVITTPQPWCCHYLVWLNFPSPGYGHNLMPSLEICQEEYEELHSAFWLTGSEKCLQCVFSISLGVLFIYLFI